MKMRPEARKWYALGIVTEPAEPAVTGWEASFDSGATWLASTVVGTDGLWRWLVAGPAADPTGATALPLGRTVPLVRATANPEIEVEKAPPIDVA